MLCITFKEENKVHTEADFSESTHIFPSLFVVSYLFCIHIIIGKKRLDDKPVLCDEHD